MHNIKRTTSISNKFKIKILNWLTKNSSELLKRNKLGLTHSLVFKLVQSYYIILKLTIFLFADSLQEDLWLVFVVTTTFAILSAVKILQKALNISDIITINETELTAGKNNGLYEMKIMHAQYV